jgi:hypothetical protein
LTQRRPSPEIVSTFGLRSRGSAGDASSALRADRRNLGFGRLGIGLAYLARVARVVHQDPLYA